MRTTMTNPDKRIEPSLSDYCRAAKSMALGWSTENRQHAMHDAIIALYWFSVDHHAGQFSDLYRLHCALGTVYQPGCLETGPEPDSTSEFIYNELERLYEFGV